MGAVAANYSHSLALTGRHSEALQTRACGIKDW